MPKVRLLAPVEEQQVRGKGGEVVRVDGPTASRLIAEGRAELVRRTAWETRTT